MSRRPEALANPACVGFNTTLGVSNSDCALETSNTGNELVIEEFLDGEEASFFALVNGEECVPLIAAQVGPLHRAQASTLLHSARGDTLRTCTHLCWMCICDCNRDTTKATKKGQSSLTSPTTNTNSFLLGVFA